MSDTYCFRNFDNQTVLQLTRYGADIYEAVRVLEEIFLSESTVALISAVGGMTTLREVHSPKWCGGALSWITLRLPGLRTRG